VPADVEAAGVGGRSRHGITRSRRARHSYLRGPRMPAPGNHRPPHAGSRHRHRTRARARMCTHRFAGTTNLPLMEVSAVPVGCVVSSPGLWRNVNRNRQQKCGEG
jgi:hypothetical protein